MNKDDLKKLGVEDEELAQKIIVLHGKDIEKHKTAVTAAEDTTKAVQKLLDEAGKTIEGFKKLDIPGIQKAAEDYRIAADKAKTDADLQVANLRFEHALTDALKEAKVKDPSDIIPHLKRDLIKLGEDGKFIGLAEQLDPLKKSKDYLFEPEETEEEEEKEPEKPEPKIVIGGHNTKVLGASALESAFDKGAGLEKGK